VEECEIECSDGNACTLDVSVSEEAGCACEFIDIVDAADNDGCCPGNLSANDDNDCAPVCGNSETEVGEECDAEEQCTQECTYVPTAYRITEMVLRDPHAFAGVFFFCTDATGQTNDTIKERIDTDTDGDGNLDLSIALVFRPLDQGPAGTRLDFHIADCAADSSGCFPGANSAVAPVANQEEGVCLAPLPGTVDYSPAPAQPAGQCFASEAQSLTVELAGLPIALEDAQVAATYVDEPATGLASGLIMGFLSEEDAEKVILPEDVPFVGGDPLASLFPGGADNCSSDDARDVGPDGETLGWWIYLDFVAAPTAWADAAPVPGDGPTDGGGDDDDDAPETPTGDLEL